MENKAHVRLGTTTERSCEHYMNAYEQALARRPKEAMLLADLTIRVSRPRPFEAGVHLAAAHRVAHRKPGQSSSWGV
jgi:hypothetical protein